MSSCSHARTLELHVAAVERSLSSRIDALEAVAGELRARVEKLERTVAVLVHNNGNHEKALRVLNEQLFDVAREAQAAHAAIAEFA